MRPNLYRVERDHAVLFVSSPLGVQKALISLCDLKSVLQYRWRAQWDKTCDRFYCKTEVRKDGKRVNLALHRFIMQPPSGMVVDHVNHDGLDNRRESLRVVTPQLNNLNRRPGRTSKLGIRGVVQRPNGKFRASVMVSRKRVLLGEYLDPKDAGAAVQQFLTTINQVTA